MKRRVLIMGAAGRDFHNFNVVYRKDKSYDVVAFTATQIPNIDGRVYPAKLAGKRYPSGIPIRSESELTDIIKNENIDEVIFSYSDVSYNYLMSKAAEVNAAGAAFTLLDPHDTMLPSSKPVISICAIRTGCGKSQTTRMVAEILKDLGKKVAVVRHPMPYGNLVKQEVQRFASLDDLTKHDCTIEEMEEYEPHINQGTIVYAGVDYEKILRRAEKEADVVLWDGGNNDTPFFKSDLQIVVFDPLRPGHETLYYPGEANARMADVAIINKINTADTEDVKKVAKSIKTLNPAAKIIKAASTIGIEDPGLLKGADVLVVEDGPTLTHGDMKIGAGVVAAEHCSAVLIDPRKYAVGSIKQTYQKYPDIGTLLPAMGYGEKQMKDLEKTINATPCDAVVIGTPIDLAKLIKINKPTVRVTYALDRKVKNRLKKEIEKAL